MNHKLLANLSDEDQARFQEFGWGPKEARPFELMHRAIEAQAEARPEAIALRHKGESMTYGELNRHANLLAWTLLQNGVRPGHNVGLFVERSIPMVVGLLAILKAGAAYVPQDARITPQSTLSHIIGVAQTKVILTLSHLRPKLPLTDFATCLNIDDEMTHSLAPADVQINLDWAEVDQINDPACFILFTSGTTGAPNGVKVSHKNVANILLTHPGGLGIKAGMTVSQVLNIAFDMAAWEIFGALTKGATLLIRGKSIEDAVAQADVVIATPSVLASLNPARCQKVKIAAVAGEPCPKPLAEAWSAFCDFYNSCGPTEVTIVNTMVKYTPGSQGITIGKPNPNTTVYILDENLCPLPIGAVGEMWAGGDCVTQGYLKNPLLTDERYRFDPFLGGGRRMFRTRDLGRWTKDGELEHHGRTDDQVKIRGFRVELDSISAAAERVPNVAQAVTLKIDDRNLATFITGENVDPTQAQTEISKHLPYYCAPSFIRALDTLPKTPRGKIDKRALIKMATEIQATMEVR